MTSISGMAKVSRWMLIIFVFFTFLISIASANQSLEGVYISKVFISGDVNPDPIKDKYVFNTTDVYAAIVVDYLTTEYLPSITFQWFDPDGTFYSKTEDVADKGGWIMWENLNISGFEPSLKEGKWHVDVFFDDVKIATKNFWIGEYQAPDKNIPPVANAGDDFEINVGDYFVIDGGSSHDPDGNIIKYEWIWENSWGSIGGPYEYTFSSNLVDTTLFEPIIVTYTLTVIDDRGDTDSDSKVITINPAPGFNDDDDNDGIVNVLDSFPYMSEENAIKWAEGDYWKYRSIQNDGIELMALQTVIGEETISGQEFYIRENTGTAYSAGTHTAYYTTTGLNGYKKINDSDTLSISLPAYDWVNFPLFEGKEWSYTDAWDSTRTYRVFGREILTIPAGTFECFVIESEVMSSEAKLTSYSMTWIPVNYSNMVKKQVKDEYYDPETGELIETWELIDYGPKTTTPEPVIVEGGILGDADHDGDVDIDDLWAVLNTLGDAVKLPTTILLEVLNRWNPLG